MSESELRSANPVTTGRVLLVDDEQHVLDAYARVLRKDGFTVVTLFDGRDVSDALRTQEFDVVMSDISMPEHSGMDVLRTVRQHDPDLPVVLMTASADLRTAVDAVELGALRYLLKPIASSVLSSTASDAIRLRKIAGIKRRAFELYGDAARQDEQRAELSASLDRALQTLHMAYQPIVSWSERRAFAYEALVRNKEPSLGRPDMLFSAARRLGRLHDLGRAIRTDIATTVSVTGAPCVFVNLHPSDLLDEDLFLASAPLTQIAQRIVLEITERASLDEIGDVRARLTRLRELGYRLAVDDLGAGYAGLTSFAQVQPDVVKVDMSLTRNVDSEATKRKLFQSVIGLCGELGMLIVAEGVETVAERDTLASVGCDLLQGYLFAKPGAPFPEPNFG
jgi:EAL domain-containing protein (putative c-di-GMP-specific phosphodiesterase class I)/ActR/RegA family two-component response regulator